MLTLDFWMGVGFGILALTLLNLLIPRANQYDPVNDGLKQLVIGPVIMLIALLAFW